ncbi:glycosyltransferase [Hymenobacter perfusus]|uniref:Glycosyltransferase n=1 Tax=Hymenobacter perfusus TaxID=1236770 RepID=A0A3R9MED1_9BACT|nr:glycosyltransferase [Hymenobacter perfusus]RSK40061.1 glycosyltransferase [Hymenobacter perfusus]
MEHATPLRFHAEVSAGAAAFHWPAIFAEVQPAPTLRACVIIPAKDEAPGLPATLAALAAQVDARGRPLPAGYFEVLLLVNNSQDATAQVARAFAARHPQLALHVAEIQLPSSEAHVGRARRLLMDAALRRLELAGQPGAFIASTDADTQVAPDWLAATATELAADADAVGGRILMADANPACPVRRCQLRDATYQLLRAHLEALLDPVAHDPWPRHHQHFGASLAVTAAAYRAVGGLPVVPHLEDEALYQLLLLHDLRVRHSPAVRVFTSSRQQGRVEVGLSWQLREWASLGRQEPLVPHPAAWAAELRARRELRKTWQATDSRLPHMSPAQTFEGFWRQIQPSLRAAEEKKYPAIPLREAITELRQLLAAGARNGLDLARVPKSACFVG